MAATYWTAVPPLQPHADLLPLLDEEYEWKRFERFCLRLVLAQSDVLDAALYGKRGEKQKGIDIVAHLVDGGRRSYQCRRYKNFTKKQAQKTVEDVEFNAREHVILLACDLSKTVSDYIDGQPGWSVKGVEGISMMVRQLRRQVGRELLEDSFGPAVRRAFLGPPGPLAFASATRFFEPYLSEERLLHHRARLVGRDAELRELKAAVDEAAVRVIVLPGAGGRGKTRLLRALMDADEDALFAVEQVELTAELVDDLPQEPLVVVVDDAHRRGDLRPLLAHARRSIAPMTLVLATRPHATEDLAAEIRGTGFDGSELRILPPLEAPSDSDMQKIAAELLGAGDDRVGALSAAAASSPLICVIGAALLRRDELEPSDLPRSSELRDEILARFRDEQLGKLGSDLDPPVVRKLMAEVAALSPVSIADDGALGALGEPIDMSIAEVRTVFDRLAGAGVLEARGRFRQVRPDVLADKLMSDAAFDANGEPTGWVAELYRRFGREQLVPLLRNAATLDWQLRGAEGRLLDEVWRDIRGRFDQSGAFDRTELLRALAPVAVLQPRHALELARHAIEVETEPEHFGFTDHMTDKTDVTRAAVSILEGVAFHAAHVATVFPLLWQLGREDTRPVGRTPGHPLKILMEAGEYGRPRECSEALLSFVERLIQYTGGEAVPAITLLRPLLAREVEQTSPRGFGLALRSLAVDAVRAAPLRERVRALLVNRATRATGGEAVLAAAMLTDGLAHPFGIFGREVTDQEIDQWKNDQLALMKAIEEVLASTADALVRITLRNGVRWHAEHSRWPEVAARAQTLLGTPPELEERALACLVGGWGDDLSIDAMLNRRKEVLMELVDEADNGAALASRIDSFVTKAQDAGLDSTLPTLIGQLRDVRPEFGAEAAQWVIDNDGPMVPALGALLDAARASDVEAADALADSCVRGGSIVQRAAAAEYLSTAEALVSPTDAEKRMLESLLEDEDVRVRQVAIRAPMQLAHSGQQHDRVKALLLGLDPRGDTVLTDRLATAVLDLGLDSFSESELSTLAAKLEAAAQLNWHAQRLLEAIGKHSPRLALEAVLRRLEAGQGAARLSRRRFEAVPDQQLSPDLLAGARSISEYLELVRLLRDAMLRFSGTPRWQLANTYWDVVGDRDAALIAIGEWLLGDDVAAREGAIALIHEMPWQMLLTHAYLFAVIIERLSVVAPQLSERLGGALLSAGTTGGHTRTIGQPSGRHLHTAEVAGEIAQRLSRHPAAMAVYQRVRELAEEQLAADRQADEEYQLLHP